ncbi:MAG: hypothetical protein RL514_1285 [Verrucomicrobiota bacterium]|jgi:hypothetical protein
MTADRLRFCRPLLRAAALLTLCATLLPLAGCKKEDATATAPAAGTPALAEPAPPEPPKVEPGLEFKAKWPIGERLVQRLETTADIEIQAPATPTAVKMPIPSGQSLSQVLELAFTALKERPTGGHEVEVETLAITTANKFGTNAPVPFTTRSDPKQDPKNTPLAGPLRKLVGGKVKYLTTADGKIEKLEGGPQFRSKGAVGAAPTALAIIASQFSDEAIKGWNTFHTGLPEQPVKPGDTWPFTRSHTYGPTALSLDATNTFKAWEQRDGRKVVLLEQAGVIVIKPPVGTTPAAFTATLEDGAKLTGKAWFDPALGVLVESAITAEFGIKLTFANGQGTASKVKVTINAKLTDAPNPGATATAEAPPTPPPAGTPPPKP